LLLAGCSFCHPTNSVKVVKKTESSEANEGNLILLEPETDKMHNKWTLNPFSQLSIPQLLLIPIPVVIYPAFISTVTVPAPPSPPPPHPTKTLDYLSRFSQVISM